MDFLIRLLADGVLLGATYALVAIGLTLIVGVAGVVNFSHGELYMLGGFVALYVANEIGAGYFVALAAAVVCLFGVGLLLHETLFRRLGSEGRAERSIVMTLGLSLFLQNGALVVAGAQPRIVDSGFDLSSITIVGTRMATLQVFAGVAALAAGAFLYVLLQRSALGRAMRALSQNREGAIVLGIRSEPVARLTVALGAAFAGLAGAALGSLYTVDPIMGISVLFKAFAIVIVGGVGNVAGAAAAALLIGIVESLAGGYGTRVLQDASAFLLMIVVLLWRPQGLFGRSIRV